MLSILTEQVYVGGKDINGANGRFCDYLSASNGDARFTVLIEIKKPQTPLIDKQDRNRSYPISKELTMAVSQVLGYCDSWAREVNVSSLNYERDNNLTTANPKGIIVIGNTCELDNADKKRSFELFRRNLHNVEIITYDELLARARYILREKNTPIISTDDELPF